MDSTIKIESQTGTDSKTEFCGYLSMQEILYSCKRYLCALCTRKDALVYAHFWLPFITVILLFFFGTPSPYKRSRRFKPERSLQIRGRWSSTTKCRLARQGRLKCERLRAHSWKRFLYATARTVRLVSTRAHTGQWKIWESTIVEE